MSKPIRRNLRKIGGPLVTRIPKEIIFTPRVTEDDAIEFYMNDGRVCIRKAKK